MLVGVTATDTRPTMTTVAVVVPLTDPSVAGAVAVIVTLVGWPPCRLRAVASPLPVIET